MHVHYEEAGSDKGTPVVMLHGGGPGASGMSNFGRNLPAWQSLPADEGDVGDAHQPRGQPRHAVGPQDHAEVAEQEHVVHDHARGGCTRAVHLGAVVEVIAAAQRALVRMRDRCPEAADSFT